MMKANEATGRNRINWDSASIEKLFSRIKPKGQLEEYAWHSFRFRCLTGLRHGEMSTINMVTGKLEIDYTNVKIQNPVDGRIISEKAMNILRYDLNPERYTGGLNYGSYHNDRNQLKEWQHGPG